jgi:serine/threonine protein kinase
MMRTAHRCAYGASLDMSDQPATIGVKFAVVRPLGKGGMGTVFEAIARDTGHRVAVKVIAANMADDPSMIARFQREVRTASALATPHIVKVVEAGVDPISKLPYMAMEYLEGEDLRQLLKRIKPLPAELALRITAQACKALEAAHAAKILHRDIKPANLFLARQGDKRVVKLLDFGVAKMQHGELHGDAELTGLTRTGSMIGSPLYMSPEQAKGYKNLDGRSDVWSLGVVLYQMLAGKTPHPKIEQLGELLVRICTVPPPPIQRRAPWVPPAVAGLLTHALAMEAEDRFASARALRESIEMLLPNGTEIAEEALRPLSAEERAIVAESSQVTRLDGSGGRPVVEAMGMSGSNPTRSAPAVFTTPDLAPAEPFAFADSPTNSRVEVAGRSSTLTSGATSMGGETVSAAPPDRKVVRMAAIGLMAGVTAAAVYFGIVRSPASGKTAEQVGSTSAADPKPRSVKLVILPKDAKVEVDGAPAETIDGVVEITGTPASVHKVRVTAGGESKLQDVVISENGPVPAKVEVEPKEPTATAGTAATTGGAANTRTTFGPKSKTTATATPAVPATSAGRTLRDDR